MSHTTSAAVMPSTRYRPDIDGLRALAVVPVVLFHAGLGCPGGYVGVDIFFIISGFLITTILLKEIRAGTFSMLTFWERRARRILPALVVVLLATLLAAAFLLLPEDFAFVGKSAASVAMVLANIFFFKRTGYFEDSGDANPLLHTWSLAVEEQFYLLFPTLLLLLLSRTRRQTTALVLAGLFITSLALSIAGSHSAPNAAFYLLPTRAWELMLGAALAAVPSAAITRRWLSEALALLGLALILFAITCYTPATRFPGLAAIPPCLGAALLILAGHGAPTLIGRALALPPLTFIGLISYSLYLWHWPLLVFSKYSSIDPQSLSLRLTLLLASLVLAILSWRYIETPFRQRTVCPQRRQMFAFAAGSTLALLLLGASIHWLGGLPSRLPATALSYASGHHDRAFISETRLDQALAGQLTELGAQSADKPIELLIWGDSHAMAATPALHTLCQKYNIRGVQAAHSSTAPILGYTSTGPYSLQAQSPAFSEAILAYVSKHPIKTVILAGYWTSYGSPAALTPRLVATVRALKSAGSQVYFLKDVPLPGYDVPRHAALAIINHRDLETLQLAPQQSTTTSDDWERLYHTLGETGATVLDTPQCFINSAGRYDVVRHGQALYSDATHISVQGSHLLVPLLEPLFQRTAAVTKQQVQPTPQPVNTSIVSSPTHPQP